MAISQQQRTELLTLLVGMFDAAPGSDILDELGNGIVAGNTIAQYAANLVESSEFTGIYSRGLTAEEFATSFIANLLGDTVDADTTAEAEAFVAGRLNAGASRDTVIIEALTALSAVSEDDTTWGAAAAQLNNKVEVAEYFGLNGGFTGLTLAQMQAAISGVTNDDATVTAKKEAIDAGNIDGVGANGQTFTLTTDVDTVVGSNGNDTIIGDFVTNPSTGNLTSATLGAFDKINGGDGVDTLSITAQVAAAYTLPGTSISNVENLVIQNASGKVTADVQSISDLESVSVALGTASDVDLDTKSNVTSVTVTKGDADLDALTGVAITDNGTAATTADALATVTLDGVVDSDATTADAVAISSDALTTLNLANTTVGASVTAAAGTRELTVGLNNVTGGVVTDSTATTVTVSATGKASSGVTVTTAAATAVNVDADEKVTLAALNAAAAKTITVTGDSAAVISAASVAALESVDASASTGGLTITPALATGVAFTGGAGKDAVTVGATTKAIAMGEGDDTVTMSVAVGTGGTVDGGAGVDTLSLSSANAATVSATDTFEAGISNFEKVSLAATGAADTVNLANLDDISYLISAGVTAGGLTVTNLASGGTFEQTGVIAAASSVAVKDAGTGAADVLNIKLNSTANTVNTAALTVSSVETINIEATDSSADTTTLTNPSAASTILLNAADATTLTVSGNHGVDFTGSTLTKVTTLDASGVEATGATSTATAAQIGTAGAVTFSSVVSDKAVTITTGNGADVISTASVTDATFLATGVTASTISTGAGNDTITGSAGKDVIDGGEGNDTITGGAGADTLTGGAGNDTFVITAASESTLANMDVITDFTANTFGNGTDGAAGTGAATDTTKWTGDVLKVNVAELTITKVDVSVQSNASDAQTFIQNISDATIDTLSAALDSSTGRLYMDVNSDGTIDSVIQLSGVTTITEAAFVLY